MKRVVVDGLEAGGNSDMGGNPTQKRLPSMDATLFVPRSKGTQTTLQGIASHG